MARWRRSKPQASGLRIRVDVAIAPAHYGRSKRYIVAFLFALGGFLSAFRWLWFSDLYWFRGRCFVRSLLCSNELERIRNDASRGALLTFAVGIRIGLQATIECKRAAFLRILRNDLGIASKDGDAKPIRDCDFFAVDIAFLAIAGDGKIEYGDITVGEVE